MSGHGDLDRFVKDPSVLVDLCRNVIDLLDPESVETSVADQEAQLRAIAKAVDQLEKSGVPVPAPLRSEKTRLAVALAVQADAKQALAQLADEFEDILKDLRERIGPTPATTEPRPRGKRSKLPATPHAVLREQIVRAIQKLGGSGRVAEVIEEMGRQLEGRLLPGDLVWRATTNEPVWQNTAKWERFQMTQDGLLRRGSPRGIWELAESSQ